MAMKETSKVVFKYLQEQNNETNLTAADIANILDYGVRQVDGIFTQAIQKKGWGYREECEVEMEDGSHKKVKFLKLTDEGLNLDLDALETAKTPDAE
jgi:hypothetical protein